MDNQSANSGFSLNHYLDQEKNTNSLTVDSGFGNRHPISEHSTDYPMASSGFSLNHYLDQEKNANSLTVDSGFGNRHPISEHSTAYPMASSGFDLNHNFDQERQGIGDEIMNDLNFEDRNIDNSVASNGIVGIQTRNVNTRYLDQNPLIINVLVQGKELLNQLRSHLNPSSSTGEFLIEKMLSSFNETLLILNPSVSETEIQPIEPISSILDSPRSVNGSPQSDDLNRRDMYKKREMLPRWSKQVRVCSRTGLKGALYDGNSWMKYGQKDILGAKYPRNYFQCMYHKRQGCLATKKVQRSEDDPSFFEVTYRERHTCIQGSASKKLVGGNCPSRTLGHPYIFK